MLTCGVPMKDYAKTTDEQLQILVAGGDHEAEAALAERYVRLVRVCARPHFLTGGDSEDLIQEGMIGLLSAMRMYDGEKGASFRAFAEVCIRNRIASALRSAARKKHEPLNSGLSLEDVLSDESLSLGNQAFQRVPEEQVLARESAQEFNSTYWRCLSKFEAQVLRAYLCGYSYLEIAAEVGRDPKAVDNAVQRIRRKLAKHPCGESSKS